MSVWTVLDLDGFVISEHATRDEAIASAIADAQSWADERPLDVKEGCRVHRNLRHPDGTVEGIN